MIDHPYDVADVDARVAEIARASVVEHVKHRACIDPGHVWAASSRRGCMECEVCGAILIKARTDLFSPL